MTPCGSGGVGSPWSRDEDSAAAPRARRARRPGRVGGVGRDDDRLALAVPAARLRRMPVVPRVCAQAGAAARRALGDRGRRRRDRRDGSSGRCARLRRRGSGLRRRLLGHQRPGGGRRRAGSRQDERTHAVRRLGWACQLARRALAPAEAPRLAAARIGLRARAATPRRATSRPLAGLAHADPGRRWDRDPRAVAVSLSHRPHRGRRHRPGADARRADARARRRVPDGAHGGRRGACRPVVAGRGRSPLRPSGRLGRSRRRAGDRAEPAGRPVGRGETLAAGLHAARCRGAGRRERSSRPVSEHPPSAVVRRSRPRDRADARPGAWARPGRLRLDRLRRTGGLREPVEPLRRDRALRLSGRGRAAGHGDDDGDPPLRHLEPDADRLSRERQRARRAAEPVVALGVERRPASGEHRPPDLVRRPGHGQRDGRHDARVARRRAGAARPRRRARKGRAGVRGAVHRGHRVRRHLPPGRSPLRARPHHAVASRRSGRVEDPRLLGLPPSVGRRPTARSRAGRDRRGAGRRSAGIRLRRLRPAKPEAARCLLARQGMVRGRTGSPRVPLVAAEQARRAPAAGVRGHAVRRGTRPADPSHRRRSPRSGGSRIRDRRASPRPAPPARRSAAPSSSATCCTPSPPPV